MHSSSSSTSSSNQVSKSSTHKTVSNIGQINFNMEIPSGSLKHQPTRVSSAAKEIPVLSRITRSSPGSTKSSSSTKQVNPYANHTYEYLNTVLHNTYGYSDRAGHLPLEYFNSLEAKKDIGFLRALLPGDVEDDEDLDMVNLWIEKLVMTMRREFDEEDEIADSDSEA